MKRVDPLLHSCTHACPTQCLSLPFGTLETLEQKDRGERLAAAFEWDQPLLQVAYLCVSHHHYVEETGTPTCCPALYVIELNNMTPDMTFSGTVHAFHMA